MTSNTHFATAKFRQEGVHDWQSEEGSTDATNLAAALDAQAEATLALAYEQRTANMIAALQVVRYEGAKEILPTSDHAWATVKEINERLGLS